MKCLIKFWIWWNSRHVYAWQYFATTDDCVFSQRVSICTSAVDDKTKVSVFFFLQGKIYSPGSVDPLSFIYLNIPRIQREYTSNIIYTYILETRWEDTWTSFVAKYCHAHKFFESHQFQKINPPLRVSLC